MQAADGEDRVADCWLGLADLQNHDLPEIGIEYSRNTWCCTVLEEPESSLFLWCGNFKEGFQDVIMRGDISETSPLAQRLWIEIAITFASGLGAP